MSLIKDVVGRKCDETRDATLEAIATLTKFDLKLEQLGSHVRMFFAGNTVPIEVAKLENLVDGVRMDYSNDNIVLKSAFGRINKVEAWDHLEWLYAQRSSPTFLHIWTDAQLDAGGGDTSKILTQEEVVKVVIPKARSVWEELATGISRGSVPMGSVRWAVSQPWAQVVQELVLLEKTGGDNAGDEM